jgi:four helix bundle protein
MIKHNFKKLIIWQESLDLVSITYKFTKKFPQEERFGLVGQLNRCSISISSNIVEGTSKSTIKYFKTYLENKINRIQNMIYKFTSSL